MRADQGWRGRGGAPSSPSAGVGPSAGWRGRGGAPSSPKTGVGPSGQGLLSVQTPPLNPPRRSKEAGLALLHNSETAGSSKLFSGGHFISVPRGHQEAYVTTYMCRDSSRGNTLRTCHSAETVGMAAVVAAWLATRVWCLGVAGRWTGIPETHVRHSLSCQWCGHRIP